MSRGFLIVIGIATLFILVVGLAMLGVLPGTRSPSAPAASLEFWGVGDDENAWNAIIRSFHDANPKIAIQYRRFDEDTYEETLVNKLAEGKGPDIFLLKNSWISKHKEKLSPLPQGALGITPRDLDHLFADIVAQDLLTEKGNILGLPLYVDTPALFYNKEILNSAGVAQLPQDWDDVVSLSQRLTQKSPTRDIIRTGLAIGTSRNVEHSFEIINSLILQNGDPIFNRSSRTVELNEPAQKALSFYTSFADPLTQNFSWNNRLPNSLDAFAQGSASLAIGFPLDIRRIERKNPHLEFGVLPFPQPKGTTHPALYGTYYFPTVSRLSKNATTAWQFIRYAASEEGVKIYLAATNRAPVLRSALARGASSNALDPFWQQVLIAQSWPVPDESATRALFERTIENVVTENLAVKDALDRLRGQLRLLVQ